MGEHAAKNEGSAGSSRAGGDNEAKTPERRDDPFPPEFAWWQVVLLAVTYPFALLAVAYLLDQFCDFRLADIAPSLCWSYVALGWLIAALYLHRFIWHEKFTFNARREDRSEIESYIVEAENVEPRIIDEGKQKPQNYEEKKGHLDAEVRRLREDLGTSRWTEYEVLSLKQKLVDFLKEDDLRARAQSILAQLKEYADDSSYLYDKEYYGKWKQRIDEATEKIKEAGKNPLTRDEAAETLRAEVRTLHEHVADYQSNWSEGSSLVRGLIICGAATIPILLVMGLLPLLHPGAFIHELGIINWGLLAIIGSLTAVLLSLRKSDLVEVGNTQGKKEILRAVLGAALGLVAGVLIYGILAGKIISAGHAVPEVPSTDPSQIALSIVWAIGAGFSFERIFERVRGITETGS